MIVAGFGFRGAATLSSCAAALALARRGQREVTLLAAPDDKAALLEPLAAALGIPLIALAADRFDGVATPTASPASLSWRGTGSVAEAAALLAAGPGARIVARRCVSPDRMATCAIARGSNE